MNERQIMNTENQMQITFDGQTPTRPEPRNRQTRFERARWWFRRMHEVVEQATDWKEIPPPRPEQTYLALQRDDMPKAA